MKSSIKRPCTSVPGTINNPNTISLCITNNLLYTREIRLIPCFRARDGAAEVLVFNPKIMEILPQSYHVRDQVMDSFIEMRFIPLLAAD